MKRDSIRIAEYVCRGLETVFELAFESATNRGRTGGQWFTCTIYGRERALQQF